MFRGMVDLVGARKELKERVDLLVAVQKETNRTLEKLAKSIEDLANNVDGAALAKALKLTESWSKSTDKTIQVSKDVVETMEKIGKLLS